MSFFVQESSVSQVGQIQKYMEIFACSPDTQDIF